MDEMFLGLRSLNQVPVLISEAIEMRGLFILLWSDFRRTG